MYYNNMEKELYDRVTVLETNYNNMQEGIASLTISIDKLNDKLEAFSSKFSISTGIFITIIFIIEFIVMPIITTYFFKK